MEIERIPADVTYGDDVIRPVANGELNDGSHRSVEVSIFLKGGDMLVTIDGKAENRFVVRHSELLPFMADIAVNEAIPAFLASEQTPEARPAESDKPAVTGEASAPFSDPECQDGPAG